MKRKSRPATCPSGNDQGCPILAQSHREDVGQDCETGCPILLRLRRKRVGRHNSIPGIVAAFLLLAAAAVLSASAQSPLLDQKPQSGKAKPAVAYLFPEQVTIPADKPAKVDLHFRVADGLHINSHAPHEESLIPTTLALPDSAGVRLANAAFPPGTDFAFAINPQEKLSVYTGEFTVHAELVAPRGEHLVQGTLHYQACNNEQCMPPHSIPVAIDIIAK